jgi:hypothetical protein
MVCAEERIGLHASGVPGFGLAVAKLRNIFHSHSLLPSNKPQASAAANFATTSPLASQTLKCQRTLICAAHCRLLLDHIAWRVEFHVWKAKRMNYSISAALRGSKRDKQHLVFHVVNYFAKLALEIHHLSLIQIAFKNGILQMIAVVATRFEHAPQTSVIRNIVANNVGRSHSLISS